jgi:hypothetical protein
MKRGLLAFLAAGLAFGVAGARGDEQADAKAVLDKAMNAMGGTAKLAELHAAAGKGKITGSDNGRDLNIALDGTWRGISHYRIDAVIDEGDKKFKGTIVLTSDQAWFKKDNETTEDAPEGTVSFIRNVFHAGRMPLLLPTFKDKGYTLSNLSETTVGEQTVLALTVSHKDFKDVRLFFDKGTGLPVKGEVQVIDPRGQETTFAFRYSDYKEFGGVKLSSKVTINFMDNKEVTLELSELKAAKKVDDSRFEKP